jgi:cell division protein FtsW
MNTKKAKALIIGGAPGTDMLFLVLVLTLAAFGTLMVFSAGTAYAQFRYDDEAFFIKRQSLWLIIGISVMLLSSRIKPEFFYKLTPYLYSGTLILLILVLIIGFAGNGAQRWISIGPLTIQPSEIAKMTMVMMLAYYFSKAERLALEKKRKKRIFIYGTIIPLTVMLIPIILVMLQKHLSCIIILGAIGILVIIAAGVNVRYIASFGAVGVGAVSCLAIFTDYTKDRITVWQNPEKYKLTGGWQTLQGLMAIGSGGLFGLGYGNSLLKHCYVSEPANDMIFAILCEELGFVGAGVTLCLFAMLVFRGYRLSVKSENTFERLVIFGITTKIAIQTLLNVAVVTNTIPNTGISLPFFSYGGSSLIMLFFEMGMILSFSRYSKIIK